MEDTLRVGVISSTHGVRGEVKVYPTTDDVNRFKKLKTVILDTGREQMTLSIESVKFFKNMVILKFKEFNNTTKSKIQGKGSADPPRPGREAGSEREFYHRSDRFKSRDR